MSANLKFLGASEETVDGLVLGEVQNPFRAKLVYDGKAQQHKWTFGESQDDVVRKCKERLEEIKSDYGDAFKMIYPKELWEVRVYKDSEW